MEETSKNLMVKLLKILKKSRNFIFTFIIIFLASTAEAQITGEEIQQRIRELTPSRKFQRPIRYHHVELMGYDLRSTGKVKKDLTPDSNILTSGDDFEATLYWKCTGKIPKSYSTFLEFRGNSGRFRSDYKWHNSSQFVAEWSMKYFRDFRVYFDVETSTGHRYLSYLPRDRNHFEGGKYIHHGLGKEILEGHWHTFIRDLQADLSKVLPGITILEVNGFLISGSGYVDDIKLRDASSVTVYEDAEDGTTIGWDIYYDNTSIGAKIENIYDKDRNSRVIHLVGSGLDSGYRLKKKVINSNRLTSTCQIGEVVKEEHSFTIYKNFLEGHYQMFVSIENNLLDTGVTFALISQGESASSLLK